jgi:hypothetical protein
MCSPVRCRNCGKVTWSGCGLHADEVMARVPEQQRCECPPEQRSTGWLSRLLNR